MGVEICNVYVRHFLPACAHHSKEHPGLDAFVVEGENFHDLLAEEEVVVEVQPEIFKLISLHARYENHARLITRTF